MQLDGGKDRGVDGTPSNGTFVAVLFVVTVPAGVVSTVAVLRYTRPSCRNGGPILPNPINDRVKFPKVVKAAVTPVLLTASKAPGSGGDPFAVANCRTAALGG